MEGSPNGGWRQVREEMGLSEELEIEGSDISPILTDGGSETKDQQFQQEFDSLENDAWALYQVAEDLNDRLREEGEYWILQVTYRDEELALDSVFMADLEQGKQYVNGDYGSEGFEYIGENRSGSLEPCDIVAQAGHGNLLSDLDESAQDLSWSPRIGGEKFEETTGERISGSFIAPGLEDVYRKKAEQSIRRTYGDKESQRLV